MDTAFEDMGSNDQFSHLMDDSAEKIAHARDSAMSLLEMASEWEDRATKLRHLAAVLILEAQEFAGEVGDLLAMEFPMSGDDSEPEDEDETENEE